MMKTVAIVSLFYLPGTFVSVSTQLHLTYTYTYTIHVLYTLYLHI